MSLKETEQRVLGVYETELPSVHIGQDAEADFLYRKKQRENLFRFALNFPPELFANRRLLDLGGGTGDSTIFYGLWGASCTLVDMNPKALARAQELFESYVSNDIPQSFMKESIFDISLEDEFDIVVCDGVLHHTEDKKRGFAILSSYLKSGGYCFLGIGNQAGSFQRNLQRAILYKFSDSDDEIYSLADQLFSKHIDRAVKYGKRSRRAVIYDSYVNPKHDSATVDEVLEWFESCRLHLYSTYPKILPNIFCDSPSHASFNKLMTHQAVGQIPELLWMTHNRNDLKSSDKYLGLSQDFEAPLKALTGAVNDPMPGQELDLEAVEASCAEIDGMIHTLEKAFPVSQELQEFFREVGSLAAALRTDDLKIVSSTLSNCKTLLTGLHGTSMTYFIGYKDLDNASTYG